MRNEKRIEAVAGYTQTDVLDGNINYSRDCDTIKEAKAESEALLDRRLSNPGRSV
jgi:hypothetical protein